jgi:DNA-binding PadR family transcriptional regulator
MRQRIGYTTAVVFQELDSGSRFGLDIMRNTGLPSGTVYPTLTRAEASGLVRARWEARALADAEGRPRRRYYELTAAGRTALSEAGSRFGAFAASARQTRSRS